MLILKEHLLGTSHLMCLREHWDRTRNLFNCGISAARCIFNDSEESREISMGECCFGRRTRSSSSSGGESESDNLMIRGPLDVDVDLEASLQEMLNSGTSVSAAGNIPRRTSL